MNEELVPRARKRVRDLRGLYVHVAIYVVFMGGLTLINWLTGTHTWWVVWPIVGWGIGLGAHAVAVLFEGTLLGPEWEERKTRELIERSSRQTGQLTEA